MKSLRKQYVSPQTDGLEIHFNSVICQSPGGGGSEGTGDGPDLIPSMPFDDIDDISLL